MEVQAQSYRARDVGDHPPIVPLRVAVPGSPSLHVRDVLQFVDSVDGYFHHMSLHGLACFVLGLAAMQGPFS